jgi:hypothetical protein
METGMDKKLLKQTHMLGRVQFFIKLKILSSVGILGFFTIPLMLLISSHMGALCISPSKLVFKAN